MNTKAAFIHEYQRVNGTHYRATEMVWVKAVLGGNRELIRMYLDNADKRKARMKVVA